MLLNLCDLFYYVKAPEYFTLLASVLKINKVSAFASFFIRYYLETIHYAYNHRVLGLCDKEKQPGRRDR